MRLHSSIRFILLAGIIVLVVGIGWYARETGFFSQDMIREVVEGYGIWGPIVFVGVYAVATVLFLPGAPLTLASGALFGPWWGTLWAVLGASLGAMCAFIASAYLGRSFISELLSGKLGKLEEYNSRIEDHGFTIIMLLRLVPLFPFNVLNFGLGLTRAHFKDYMTATVLGIIPGAFVYAYLGSSLAELSMWKIATAIGLLCVLIVAGHVGSKLMRTKQENEYDIIVIGAGSGGLNVAGFMNRIGSKVLLIDKSDESIGGDCLNYGCVPSKALLHVAQTVQSARDAGAFGVSAEGSVDIRKVMDYIKDKQSIIREHENADYFRSKGMDVVLGEAKFSGPRSVQVGEVTYTAQRIVLATGSRPRELSIPGIEEAQVYTNETIFDITQVPKEFVFIGGGPISIEMAQAFGRLGSCVTVVDRNDEILGKEDPEMARVVRTKLEEEGVTFLFGCSPSHVTDGRILELETADGTFVSVDFDALFVSIGRELNTEGLDLEKAGIALDESGRRVDVDDYLRTTNKNVFTVGDIAGQHIFTHAAELHASTVLGNFFKPRLLWKKLNTDEMTWVTYTSPEIATFGLSEGQLKEQGMSYTVREKTFEDDDRAITDEYRSGRITLFIDKHDRIRGGTLVAEHAGEIAQELILAMHAGMKVGEVFSKIYPYPTATRINKSVIGEHMAQKLTPLVKRVLRVLY